MSRHLVLQSANIPILNDDIKNKDLFNFILSLIYKISHDCVISVVVIED